jgi:hypothetical protein
MRARSTMAVLCAFIALGAGCENRRPNGAECLKNRDCESRFCQSAVCSPMPNDTPGVPNGAQASSSSGASQGGSGGAGGAEGGMAGASAGGAAGSAGEAGAGGR